MFVVFSRPMPDLSKKKVVSMRWPESDRIELSATWLEGSEPLRFCVQRKHDGVLRGHWEFEYTGNLNTLGKTSGNASAEGPIT